jgi:CBS domain containing-hemolysin-like protein
MGVDLDDEDIDTIGGWVYNLNPELDVGETFTVEHMEITLLEKDHHRVRRVELKHASREDAPSPGDRHGAY